MLRRVVVFAVLTASIVIGLLWWQSRPPDALQEGFVRRM
jgi:hypothetical protein